MKVQRVEQHIIKKSNINYKMLDNMCFASKNLYNYTLYVIRQAYTGKHENIQEYADLIKNEKFIDEYDLTLRMAKLKQVDFKSLDKVQSAQQVVKLVYKNMKSFYKAIKEYAKNKSKFLGRPKLPKYKDKNGRNIVVFTNQSSTIKNGEIFFTKFKKLKKVKTSISKDEFQQIRIIHKGYYIVVEIVYNKEIEENKNKNFENSIGIDLGISNLVSITSDNGLSLIVNGRVLKSINQYFNKEASKLKSQYAKQGIKTGKRLQLLTLKRNNKIKDYMHKVSKFIVYLCLRNEVKKVFIGHNLRWKNECNMGKKNNQNFVQIPFNMLIQMLQYKLNEIGSELVILNESHTSKCSFLDNEDICHHEKYAGKRVKRGLFRSSNGRLLNADINGSLNILKRGLKKDFAVEKSIFNPLTFKTENAFADARNCQAIEALCLSQ